MTTRRTRVAALILAAVATAALLTACTTEPPAPTAHRTSANFDNVPLVPSTGVYLGMYYGDASEADTVRALGRQPQLHLTYFSWNDAWPTDPVITHDADTNAISLVNWEPFDVKFADIVAGKYDTILAERARQAADLPNKVFLDFAAEMNEEEGWGDHDPELYVATYRHIHDIFAGRDGGNVVWVWAPNNVDSVDSPDAKAYYPGADYVDWTGIDGYNWGTSDSDHTWETFTDVFQEKYDDLHTLGKPILIGETASAEEGGDKAAWIDALPATLPSRFPDIRGLVWFDVKKERDWRIHSSPLTMQAFTNMAKSPLFSTT